MRWQWAATHECLPTESVTTLAQSALYVRRCRRPALTGSPASAVSASAARASPHGQVERGPVAVLRTAPALPRVCADSGPTAFKAFQPAQQTLNVLHLAQSCNPHTRQFELQARIDAMT